jgi:signal transduction histidine kinase/phage shock protein PspC (stress-responsive transcriptional regulator)
MPSDPRTAPASPPPPPRPAPAIAPGPPAAGSAGRAGPGRFATSTRLRRLPHDRLVAGVAAGLGWRLGVDPVLVRIAFALLAFAGGAGLVLYGVLWAVLPVATDDPPPRRPATTQQGVALALIVLGILLLLRALGIWFGDQIAGPLVLLAAGSAVLWTRADADERATWGHLGGQLPTDAARRAAAAPTSPVRIVIGTALVALAIAGALATAGSFRDAQDLILVLLLALVGAGLLFGPWLWRLVDQLSSERRERVRQEERAELAAHLHDSVLQTLALIQRSDDPKRMVTLARRQERELRTWLYGASTAGAAMTLTEAVQGVTSEVEAIHGIAVEVVVVGDASLDEHVWALLAAVREACVNAAKHSGAAAVDVYVEVEGDEVLAFIRDRGRGFDPDRVPTDRAGIRRSIIERIERHGGTARLHSEPGAGTEVELSVPRPERPNAGWATDPAPTEGPGPDRAGGHRTPTNPDPGGPSS